MTAVVIQQKQRVDTGFANPDDVIACFGFCCMNVGLYFKCPEMLGCMLDGVCCCWLPRCICCKPVGENAENKCCICCDLSCLCVLPQSCCGLVFQCCFLDWRGAFPCNNEVPCVLACCGCTCFPWCGWCKKFGELRPRKQSDGAVTVIGAGAPRQFRMTE